MAQYICTCVCGMVLNILSKFVTKLKKWWKVAQERVKCKYGNLKQIFFLNKSVIPSLATGVDSACPMARK